MTNALILLLLTRNANISQASHWENSLLHGSIFIGFDLSSQLQTKQPRILRSQSAMLGTGPSTDQVVLWVQLPVGARSSHTKDFKNGSGPCLHGTDEVGTMKHNWFARCQYNVTGWVSMWACDMLSQ